MKVLHLQTGIRGRLLFAFSQCTTVTTFSWRQVVTLSIVNPLVYLIDHILTHLPSLGSSLIRSFMEKAPQLELGERWVMSNLSQLLASRIAVWRAAVEGGC
eukprot:GFUD01109306.1.p1 GENE.GFUD01109306.1~~GFUD01109306.1.p1  ORF type:complete len:101 (-),score=6.78 GFUD01109306.1:812-1114(-)